MAPGDRVEDKLAGGPDDPARLARLLRRALDTPAYRTRFGATPDDVDRLATTFSALPLLHKQDLVEVAGESDPFGGRLAVSREELAHIFVAPGPVYAAFTADDLQAMADSYAWGFRLCGLLPSDVVDQAAMYNWVMAATILDAGLRRLGCTVVPGGPGQTERHVEVLSTLQVDAIVGFPSFVEHLLRDAASRQVPLKLRVAAVMGEFQDPEMKHRVRALYGVDMRQFYATSEVGVVAAQCPAVGGLHLNQRVLVEFLDPHTADPVVPEPGAPAELVVTEFTRQAMPIVRYATGDLVDSVVDGPCSCGLDTPRIGGIVGRTGEITKVKGMFLVPSALNSALRRHGVVAEFQLHVDRAPGGQDTVSMLLATAAPPDAANVEAAVCAEARMRLEFRWDEVLPAGSPKLDDRRLRRMKGDL